VNSAKPIFKSSAGRRLENIFRDHLTQERPLSREEIASKLGYKADNAIRTRFPELCRAITAKRRLHPGREKEKVRLALQAARTENPPPSLMQIARRLGFSSEEALLTADPEMCASHSQWRREWIEEQRDDLRRFHTRVAGTRTGAHRDHGLPALQHFLVLLPIALPR